MKGSVSHAFRLHRDRGTGKEFGDGLAWQTWITLLAGHTARPRVAVSGLLAGLNFLTKLMCVAAELAGVMWPASFLSRECVQTRSVGRESR